MTSVESDPRLIGAAPGVRGAVRDFGRRLSQGDLGSLPVVLGLVIVAVYFQVRNHHFLSSGNLTNLVLQMISTGVIAVGVVLILLLGEIDLSVGAVSGFCAATMAILNTQHGWPGWAALLAGVVTGAIVGLLQGTWVTYFRVPAFLVTLAGLLAWQGALLRVLGKTGSVNLTDKTVLRIANTFYGPVVTWTVAAIAIAAAVGTTAVGRVRRVRAGLSVPPVYQPVLRSLIFVAVIVAGALVFNDDRGTPLALLILLGIVVVIDVMLKRSRLGRHIYAVGGNMEAARRAGIPVQRVRVLVFVLASTLAAVGGLLEASRGRSVTQGSGSNDVLLFAIAAAVIGGTSLFGGRGSAVAALLGAFVIGAIKNGMTLLQFDSNVRFIVTGTVLLVAATIDAVSRRGRASAGRA